MNSAPKPSHTPHWNPVSDSAFGYTQQCELLADLLHKLFTLQDFKYSVTVPPLPATAHLALYKGTNHVERLWQG